MTYTDIKETSVFDETLKDEKNRNKLIVVDFFATWCGPCRLIAPKFNAFSETYTNAVFLKVDVDEVPEVAAKAGISAMPTFHVFKNGNKVDELVGADPVKLEAMIKKHL